MSEKSNSTISENNAILSNKTDWLVGVPTKYGKIALLPTYVANFGYGENVLTRDNVVVTFTKVEHWDSVNQDLEAKCLNLYKMRFAQFEQAWRRRMVTDFGNEWDLIYMEIVDRVTADGEFEII